MTELIEVINLDRLDLNSKKKNVCAYARVSTASDSQLNSFANQVSTYTNEILNNPNWNFIGVYADEGISGTGLKKRNQFNMMLTAANHGLIDLILTKSISRFARNTIDCLKTIQDLKRIGIEVYFEKENISSFDPGIEFIISVLSGMAEEESRTISENVKWGNTKRFENGIFHMVTKRVLGYEHDSHGRIIINEHEASTVKKIYEMFLEGYGSTPIIKYLEDNNIKSPLGNTHWNKSAIYGILKNEKYTGNAMLQKTYRPSFKSNDKVINNGALPKFYVLNSHPAIISIDMFDEVQALRKQKSLKYHKSDKKDLKVAFSKETPYTGLIHCPHCGKNFNMKTNKIGSEFASRYLQCSSNKLQKKCISETISCHVIDQQMIQQINLIIQNKNDFIKSLTEALNSDIRIIQAKSDLNQTQAKIKAVESKLELIKDSSDEFHQTVLSQLNKDLYELKITEAMITNKLITEMNVDAFILEIKQILKPHQKPVSMLSEFPYKSLFSKIIIQSRDQIIFVLGMRNDYENIEIPGSLYLPGVVSYNIRKTAFQSTHGILFY
ncbi:MAG: recombinase family protein [Tenericutes bacterium HGW-Tenericutes-2]|jgi:DNA invertase Pin-like site-specific DNA recombinase|nr:MAG: recombinase family protein [Tenericutes bacterium HGW-Tenericutes-2]